MQITKEHKKEPPSQKVKEWSQFQERINKELLQHEIILNNKFTTWFRKGEATEEQVKAFIQQFSVFSNLFLIAQLKKMINAPTLETMRASKEILANEIGVIFNSPNSKTSMQRVANKDLEGDPELVSTEGSIEGGKFRFQAAHFEWLMKIAHQLGLKFQELGKRSVGTPSTLFFCDELARLYGSEDYETSQAASYAIENWAKAGFWKDLIQGLTLFKEKQKLDLPLAFFTWHDRLENQHAALTQEELEEYFLENHIDQNKFIKRGNEMLTALLVFWNGLDELRKTTKPL